MLLFPQMMVEQILEISLIVLFLVLSFTFSGSEVSIFSISEVEKLKLSQKRGTKVSLLLLYLDQPQKALITILIGNMVVNLSASILGERLSGTLFVHHPLFYSVFIMTFLVLLFGEIIPKKIAASKPTTFALRFIRLIEIANKLFFPLIFIMSRLIRPRKDTKLTPGLSKEELISAVEVSSSAGLDTVSIKVLKNLISHIDKPVTDIMVPRSDMQAVDIDGYWTETEKFIQKTPFSTVLFFEENIDNIVGYLLKTDLLDVKKKNIKERLRTLYFVPESKSIFSLLNDFKQKNEFIAIVLDEYGGTTGLVTLKDILDSIFVQDLRLKSLIRETMSGKWQVIGNTKLSDINSYFHLSLPIESVTLSGYIINMIGKIPEAGTIWSLVPEYLFKIVKSDNRQIALLEIVKVDD
jgi:putative hemolysin